MTVGMVLAYCLVSYGLTFMLQYATLWRVPRDWLRGGPHEGEGGPPAADRLPVRRFFHALFDCPFCVGTWSGIILALVGTAVAQGVQGAPVWMSEPLPVVAAACACGLASATIGLLADLAVQRLI